MTEHHPDDEHRVLAIAAENARLRRALRRIHRSASHAEARYHAAQALGVRPVTQAVHAVAARGNDELDAQVADAAERDDS